MSVLQQLLLRRLVGALVSDIVSKVMASGGGKEIIISLMRHLESFSKRTTNTIDDQVIIGITTPLYKLLGEDVSNSSNAGLVGNTLSVMVETIVETVPPEEVKVLMESVLDMIDVYSHATKGTLGIAIGAVSSILRQIIGIPVKK